MRNVEQGRKQQFKIVWYKQRNNVHTNTKALCARKEDKFTTLTKYKAHQFCAHFESSRANYSLKGAQSVRWLSSAQISASCGVYF